MISRITRRLLARVSIASCSALLVIAIPTLGARSQGKKIVHGSPAELRVGGISSLSHTSEHGNGVRVLGSVHVGPPVLLMEKVEPYSEGEAVVPIVYTFLFLQGSEWRTTSDGLFFRPPADREPLAFKTWVRGADRSGQENERTELDVSIRPRDELTWSGVETKLDIVVEIDVVRTE